MNVLRNCKLYKKNNLTISLVAVKINGNKIFFISLHFFQGEDYYEKRDDN